MDLILLANVYYLFCSDVGKTLSLEYKDITNWFDNAINGEVKNWIIETEHMVYH